MRDLYHKQLFKRVAKNTGVPLYKVQMIIIDFWKVSMKKIRSGFVLHIRNFGKIWLRKIYRNAKGINWKEDSGNTGPVGLG